MNSRLVKRANLGALSTDWISSRPISFVFISNLLLGLTASSLLFLRSPTASLTIERKTRCASVSASVDSLALEKTGWPSGYLSMLHASTKCFYLHSDEHIGCLVSLHQLLAVFLQTIHQPNIPALKPSSLDRSTCNKSLLGIGFNGIFDIFSCNISVWIYTSCFYSGAEKSYLTYFTLASYKHTLSTMFRTMLWMYRSNGLKANS